MRAPLEVAISRERIPLFAKRSVLVNARRTLEPLFGELAISRRASARERLLTEGLLIGFSCAVCLCTDRARCECSKTNTSLANYSGARGDFIEKIVAATAATGVTALLLPNLPTRPLAYGNIAWVLALRSRQYLLPVTASAISLLEA